MNWYKTESGTKPQTNNTTSSKVYNYVRRNIIEETRTDEDGNETIVYTYDECKILKSSWGIYTELLQAQADIDYLTMITEDL